MERGTLSPLPVTPVPERLLPLLSNSLRVLAAWLATQTLSFRSTATARPSLIALVNPVLPVSATPSGLNLETEVPWLAAVPKLAAHALPLPSIAMEMGLLRPRRSR